MSCRPLYYAIRCIQGRVNIEFLNEYQYQVYERMSDALDSISDFAFH